MQIYSFHLAEAPRLQTVQAFLRAPNRNNTSGLVHAECMAAMTLGAPIISPERMKLRQLAVFASWKSESALDAFLADTKLGNTLTSGWHVRMKFLRCWGHFPEFGKHPENVADADPTQPVVAVTLARLKLPQVSRFIRWGKPVEELVRDHPGTTLALAAMRPLRTFSTFSVWRTQQEMTDMVHGHGSKPGSSRHAEAMAERNRQDFHYQFTTLRFRALSEHGEWKGQRNIVPKCTAT